VIAEDQVLLREGLGKLFEDAGHEAIASLGDADGLPLAIAEHDPDLVVLDIRMPPTFTEEGARAAKEIKLAHPELGVLVLSQHIETTHAVELVTLGGFGYLLKDRVLEVGEFLAAAERVANGGSALDPQVVGSLVGAHGEDDPLAELTEREREVLELVAEGLTKRRHRQAPPPERAHGRGTCAPRAHEARHSRRRRRSPPSPGCADPPACRADLLRRRSSSSGGHADASWRGNV
jgi:DNA-binding NarL/FixJ family response regulator